MKDLVRELAQYARAKKGAQQKSEYRDADEWEHPQVELPGVSWGKFFEREWDFADGEMHPSSSVRLPVLKRKLTQHRKKYPAIQEADMMPRDGHTYLEASLDAPIPLEFWKTLIDDAYLLVWNKLGEKSKWLIELASEPYDEAKYLACLIDQYDMKLHEKAIRKVTRPAILLRTRKSTEAKIPLGASKIGGRPDLPSETEWPVYEDGRPLAFLTQLDLAEIAKLGTPLPGLPTTGLLSVFSAWGWMEEGDGDPQTPEGDGEDQARWTVVIHTPSSAKLERQKIPRMVNSYTAAAVEAIPILSLPNHRVEPPLAALKWTDELYYRFDSLQADFRSLQMRHYLKDANSLASHHLLGGYAIFQQQFPEELLKKRLTMFLQIGWDKHTQMMWGDGGELTFYADAKALKNGRFEKLWGTCQGG